MTFNSKSLYANQIEVESGRTPGEQVVIGDALSGVGGNVAGKAVKTGNTIQGNPELEFQLRDVWDVQPFFRSWKNFYYS